MAYLSMLSIFVLIFLFGCGETDFRQAPKTGDLTPFSGEGGPLKDDGPGTPEKKWVPYTVSDSFEANNQQKVDFLFVVDNSGSMGDEIQATRDQLGNFVNQLQSRRSVDYQVGVTTTNFVLQSKNNSWLRSSNLGGGSRSVAKSTSDANAVQIVQDMLANIPIDLNVGDGYTPPGTEYSWMEMGILSAQETIKNAQSQFMRPGVDLAVITISDEDDHSDPLCTDLNNQQCKDFAMKDKTDATAPYLPIMAAKQFYQGLNRSVMYHPLVGLSDPVCNTVYSIGTRYSALAQSLGFSAGNICTNATSGGLSPLEEGLLAIADSISARGICFPLSKKATGQELNVSIVTNGNSVPVGVGPGGYTFEGATNAICFGSEVVFDGSSQVAVSYQSLRLE